MDTDTKQDMILGFFLADMIGAVVFVLMCVFDDFRKVFDAVFQFHHALLCRLSGFGFTAIMCSSSAREPNSL